MPARDHDVIIVGARCAGATLAAFLAREGARVLVLDKDPLPSDHVLSTHFITPAGMDVLDDIGVGHEIRAGAPPVRVIRASVEGAVADAPLPPGRAAYCPRRERLDGLLQQAAVTAGAELRDRTCVKALLRDGERVVGVQAVNGGRESTFTAALVVGADGRHSTVARLVEAQEYLGYRSRRAAFWGYWKAPPFWKSDPAYRFDMYFSYVGDETGVLSPTDGDRLIIGSWPAADRGTRWREDPLRSLHEVFGAEPVIGPLIRSSAPDGKLRGTVKESYFFRTGTGNGWALVGDAGHHKDFVIGDGITEALLQARGLAAAILDGSDAALNRWWRCRDVAALPWHFLGKEAGASGPPPDLYRVLVTRLATHPALTARLVEAIDQRRLSLREVPALQVLWWTLAAILGGRPRVIGEILAMAARAAPVYREWRKMHALMADADALNQTSGTRLRREDGPWRSNRP